MKAKPNLTDKRVRFGIETEIDGRVVQIGHVISRLDVLRFSFKQRFAIRIKRKSKSVFNGRAYMPNAKSLILAKTFCMCSNH